MTSSNASTGSAALCAVAVLGVSHLTACGGASGASPSSTHAAPSPSPSLPAVTLTAQTTTLYLGESVVLNWELSGAPTPSTGWCTASGGWSGSVGFSGTQVVTPASTGEVTYTITCSDGAGDADPPASVTVNVQPANTHGYVVTQLVADATAGDVQVDPNLIQPWGIATFSAGFGDTASGGLQVVNEGSSTITGYDPQGQVLTSIDEPSSFFMGKLPGQFEPIGLARNLLPDSAFAPGPGFNCGETHYFVAGASGALAGFTLGCGTFTIYAASDGAEYLGVAADTQQIYVTDFHNGKIDVFNASLQKVALAATQFVDPMLPANYTPFGIRAICSADEITCAIYVSYAQRDPQSPDTPASGSGLGLIDVFAPSGEFLKRLVQPGGALNAPWGMAMAPVTFGSLSNALLIGDVGDGTINAYDPASGQFIAGMTSSSGAPLAIAGLHGIDFSFSSSGPGAGLGTLFFSAAPSGANHGMIGSITLPRP